MTAHERNAFALIASLVEPYGFAAERPDTPANDAQAGQGRAGGVTDFQANGGFRDA